jgi:hypothetical protein
LFQVQHATRQKTSLCVARPTREVVAPLEQATALAQRLLGFERQPEMCSISVIGTRPAAPWHPSSGLIVPPWSWSRGTS